MADKTIVDNLLCLLVYAVFLGFLSAIIFMPHHGRKYGPPAPLRHVKNVTCVYEGKGHWGQCQETIEGK